jgi:hypothetical protein
MPVGDEVLSGVQYMPVWVNVLAGVLDVCVEVLADVLYTPASAKVLPRCVMR